jgi:hypothetical protein
MKYVIQVHLYHHEDNKIKTLNYYQNSALRERNAVRRSLSLAYHFSYISSTYQRTQAASVLRTHPR